MSAQLVDVAVVGASLGGMTAALHLARAGFSVAVFDASSFPRRKACGEGLSVQGIEEFERLGLGEAVQRLPHHPFYGFRFFEGTRRSQLILKPMMHGIGVRRTFLDTLLVEEGELSGIGVHLGECVRVERMEKREFHLSADTAEVRARYLVLATGAHSSLPQRLGVPTHSTERPRCGLSIPVRFSKPHGQSTVDILVDPRMQVCSTPVDGDTVTLSLFCSDGVAKRFVPKERCGLIDEVCERLGIVGEVCDAPLTVSGLGRTRRVPHHDSIFVVGDALRQLDPIGGMGMTHALMTGRIAADTIAGLLQGDVSALRTHELRTRRAVRRLFGYTALTYWSLATRVGREVLGRQKAGPIAREVMLSMHRPSSLLSPLGLVSTALIQSAGLW